MNDLTVCYIGLGSNMGESKNYFKKVISVIANQDSFGIPMVSSYYRTSAVGDESQPDYLNTVVKVETSYSSKKTLILLLGIEKALGRVRDPENQNAGRVIDCDLLLFGREELESQHLMLPHPRMTQRLFVMDPLVEVAPKAYIPGYGYAKEVRDRLAAEGVYEHQSVEKVEK